MTLKNTYLEPRYVLLLPDTREGHERRLLEKGVYTAEEIQLTLDRAEFYAQFNAEHPGFFDTTVFSGTTVQFVVRCMFTMLANFSQFSFTSCFSCIVQCCHCIKPAIQQLLASSLTFHIWNVCSKATKPVHRLQICPIMHN